MQQAGFGRIVDHVEDVAGIDFFFLQRSFASIAHAYRRSVDDHVEGEFFQVGAFHGAGVGTAGELLSSGYVAVEDVDFDSAFFQAEYGGAGGASGAQH